MEEKGLLVVISAPSGGGKTTIIRKLMRQIPRSARVVTTTTRSPRPQEKDGVDYYFIIPHEFAEKIRCDAFVEHVTYAGHAYGLEKEELEKKLRTHDVVFALLEVRGEKRLDVLKIPHIAIFLVPESIEALKKHIMGRGRMSSDTLKERLAIARQEIAASRGYDYRIFNREGRIKETVERVLRVIMRRLDNKGRL